MSPKPGSASQSASGRVKAITPRKPSMASTRSSRGRDRIDLLATRIGLPAARRTRAAALARKRLEIEDGERRIEAAVAPVVALAVVHASSVTTYRTDEYEEHSY